MRTWDDERLERIISALLRTGVILSALVVLAGAVCYLMRHGQEPPYYHAFRGTPAEYRSPAGAIRAAGPSNCQAVIQLGLLLLIATPVARVAFSLVAFGLEGDRTYVALTAIVLAVLLYSLAAPF